ncbi:MAG: hypothetical protein CMO80_14720 [Verrucomicrobiales bacterium]|nr:hypothetical protein [Verrucomicrobiales bacterium]
MPQGFLKRAGRILNSGQSRALLLTGNVYDLFGSGNSDGYVPLLDYLIAKWNLPEYLVVIYELNGRVRFLNKSDEDAAEHTWLRHKVGLDGNEIDIQRMLKPGETDARLDAAREVYSDSIRKTLGNPSLALEFLRQLCVAARAEFDGERNLQRKLLILVESADLLIPDTAISSLSEGDRRRISILHDWLSDPGYLNGEDSVVLLVESRSLLHHRIARLPQVLEVEVPAPDQVQREEFVRWFKQHEPDGQELKHWGTEAEFAKLTAGLSVHALMQLLKGARHEKREITQDEIIGKVEEFIQSQLGEETVEFKKPSHRLDDLVGFRGLKTFLRDELIPRFQLEGSQSLSGAAVGGPVGGGKTFVFEAVAAETDMVVLVLKSIRSKWFGETDVIFERLRRVLNTLSKVLIFIDEADTQLGGVGEGAHDTERRLTGKIQAMMSDPTLRGRVFWLLVTARIHLLSPDLRRPGRVGDLIIPVLDPEEGDREEFVRWMVKPVWDGELSMPQLADLQVATFDYSAAAFASIRSELTAKRTMKGASLEFVEILSLIRDHLSPAIRETRRFQTLQALLNCTRRSLLPNPDVTDDERMRWQQELDELGRRGVS